MAYLMIVKREGEKWVVDDDSVHLLEDEGGNYPVQELTVTQLRAITGVRQYIPTEEILLTVEEIDHVPDDYAYAEVPEKRAIAKAQAKKLVGWLECRAIIEYGEPKMFAVNYEEVWQVLLQKLG